MRCDPYSGYEYGREAATPTALFPVGSQHLLCSVARRSFETSCLSSDRDRIGIFASRSGASGKAVLAARKVLPENTHANDAGPQAVRSDPDASVSGVGAA